MSAGSQAQLERGAIGIALQGARDLRDMHMVKPEWFTNPVHAGVWRIIQTLEGDGQQVDPLIVAGNVQYADELVRKQITGEFLASCLIEAPFGHLGETYGRRLREAHDRHTTSQALVRAQQMLEGGASTRDVRLEAMQGLQAVTDEEAALVGLHQSVGETLLSFDEVTPYVPTPWKQINKSIRGWRPGGFYVVGARPAVGKSLVLQAAALDLARRGPVILETMEMSHREVTTRLLSTMTGISQNLLVGRRDDGTSALGPSEWDQLNQAGKQLAALPLAYGERTRTPSDIREHARAARARGPLQGIFVDYLQLMAGGGRTENRVQELTTFTRQLKQMAMEFECPVIVASQLNRNAANVGRAPHVAELRDSGSIEQDADVVILLHADPSVTTPVVNGRDIGVPLDAIIGKNRQGPESVGQLRRFGTTATIADDPNRSRITATEPIEEKPRNHF